jgi:hypothetical protein
MKSPPRMSDRNLRHNAFINMLSSLQILAVLKFYAKGGYQKGVQQDSFTAVGQSTVLQCIKAAEYIYNKIA